MHRWSRLPAAISVIGAVLFWSASPLAVATVPNVEVGLETVTRPPVDKVSFPVTTTSTTTPSATPTTAAPATTTTTTVPVPPPAAAVAQPQQMPPAPTTTAPTATTTSVPAESLLDRAERAAQAAIPAPWLERIPLTISIIEGDTSWANGHGRIEIGTTHASGRFEYLVDVIGHEFGHEIAFAYGTYEYAGAAPEGWPEPAVNNLAEAWADCVQQAFTGRHSPSHGLPPCAGDSLDWTVNWLADPVLEPAFVEPPPD